MNIDKVIITGASGLLGRAVFRLFKIAGYSVEGWSHSRGDFRKVDLTDENMVTKALLDFRPNVIVHVAAIRRPDEIKNDEKLAENLNVQSNKVIAAYIETIENGILVYISTDYVFNGKNPPYNFNTQTNPINKYGEQKVAAEELLTRTLPGSRNPFLLIMRTLEKSAIIRVPIMYGPVEYLGEGAVDEVLKNILTKIDDSPLKLDNYHQRYPTHVDDVAEAILLLVKSRKTNTINGVYQWSSGERMTKYEMALLMASKFGLPCAHFVADSTVGAGAYLVVRPHDCRMNLDRLNNLGARAKISFIDGIGDLSTHLPS